MALTHEEMNREADEIRQRWMTPAAEAEPRKKTEQDIIEDYKASIGRPLNAQDTAHLAALTADFHTPVSYRDRDYRRAVGKLLWYDRHWHSNVMGGIGPSDETIATAPEVWRAILRKHGVVDSTE